jgi:hypothetical protein
MVWRKVPRCSEEMNQGSYIFIQKWLMSILPESIASMWQARLVTGIIALAMYDYLSSPYGAEGQNAFAFFNSSTFRNYCQILGISEKYVLDMMNKVEYDEKTDTFYYEHKSGLRQT